MKLDKQKTISILLLTALLLSLPVFSAPKYFRTIGLRLDRNDLYYRHQGEDVQVRFRRSARSQFYAFENSFPPPDSSTTNAPQQVGLVFYELQQTTNGETNRVPVARVDFSNAEEWMLLTARKDVDAPGGIRIEAIPDDINSFPAPKLAFVNHTAAPLGVQVGDTAMRIPPRGVRQIDPSLVNEGRGEVRQTRVAILRNNDAEIIYANNWVVRPGTIPWSSCTRRMGSSEWNESLRTCRRTRRQILPQNNQDHAETPS